MAVSEQLVSSYCKKLSYSQQNLQTLLSKQLSDKEIRRQLHLSPRRMNRLMLEMDELAFMVLGQKEPAGDYGCQNICSARSYCEEGGVL